MMKHPSLEQLRAFATGDSPSRRRQRTATHLAGCGGCRERVAWIREFRAAAAEATALPAPKGAWERIVDRVAAEERVLLPVGDLPTPPLPAPRLPATPFRHWSRSTGLRAALLVLGLAGVASATVPGSPVRAWIGRVLPLTGTLEDGKGGSAASAGLTPDPGAESAYGADAAPAEAELLVPLVDGALTIRIEQPDPELRIRVRVGEETDLLVHASGGAAGGRFRTGAGRLTIEEAGAGEVVIGVPARAGRVSLEVDGQLYLIKEAGRLRILVPVADTVGSEFVFSPGRGGGAAARP